MNAVRTTARIAALSALVAATAQGSEKARPTDVDSADAARSQMTAEIRPVHGSVGCDGIASTIPVTQASARCRSIPSAPVYPPLPLSGSGYFFAGGEIVSSPKPINLVGNENQGIVFGTSAGQIYVLDGNGAVVPGWPVASGSSVGYSSAAIADLNNDDAEDIVVHSNNALEAYDQNGAALPGWPQYLDSGISGNSLIGSPTIADIDDDDDLEILVGHFKKMYAFHHDGTLVSGWPLSQVHNFGPLYATPAVGDLDGDGDAEICFKIYGGNGDPADVHLFHHDGTKVDGWPKLDMDRSHLSSPVFADIDNDLALDIVVSLHVYTGGNYVKLYAWKMDGSDVSGFPVLGSWNTSPESNAVGDVDEDGLLEIFVSTSNATSPYYAIHAWNNDGTVLSGSWPRSAPMCLYNGSPILADIDGGHNEVMIGVGGCYVSDTGVMNVWADDGSMVPSWPRSISGKMRSSALVMDSDGDSTPEIYVGSADGWIHRFLPDEAKSIGVPQWNQIFHDPQNTNCYLPLIPPCPADVTGDNVVDVLDLLAVLAAWGEADVPEDINGDGTVDVLDLLEVLSSWGPC